MGVTGGCGQCPGTDFQKVGAYALHYEEYHDVEILGTTYSSTKSRSSRSSAVLAVWPSPRGILESRTPSKEDIRIGSVNYFLLHDSIVNLPGQEAARITHRLAEM